MAARSRLLTRIGAVAALAVSLAIPASRELHVLTARLLFRIETQNTYVQSQPSGCGVQVVPNVRFSEEFKKECLKESSQYPHAFILASSLSVEHGLQKTIDYPPLQTWSNHPWLDRAAFELPSPLLDADWAKRSNSWTSNDTVVDVDRALLNEALDRCRLAQSKSPRNGALWLAEAHLLLMGGFDDQGLNALQTAASKGNWRSRTGFAYEYKKQLFDSEGLPALDAAIEAWESTGMPSCRWGPMYYLYDIMASVVIARDDAEFSSIVSLVHTLQDQSWQYIPSGFPFYPSSSGDLIEAMAERLGREDPPGWEGGGEQRREAQVKIFKEYLTTYLDAELAKETLVRAQPKGDGYIQICDPAYYRVLRYGTYSSVGALMCLFLLTALCVGFVLETPFLVLTEFVCPRRSLPKSPIFWMISIVVLVLVGIICLSASAPSSVRTDLGVRGSSTIQPLLDPDLRVLLVALGSSIAWFGLRVYFRGADRRFKTALLFLSFLYLGAIGSTAYLRFQVVEQLDAYFIVPPTAAIDG